MTQTSWNRPKNRIFDIFKIILNSNKLQIRPNHFLVGDNIAPQYLDQLSHFTIMHKWLNYYKTEVK
jgi:hypothetical protein